MEHQHVRDKRAGTRRQLAFPVLQILLDCTDTPRAHWAPGMFLPVVTYYVVVCSCLGVYLCIKDCDCAGFGDLHRAERIATALQACPDSMNIVENLNQMRSAHVLHAGHVKSLVRSCTRRCSIFRGLIFS